MSLKYTLRRLIVSSLIGLVAFSHIPNTTLAQGNLTKTPKTSQSYTTLAVEPIVMPNNYPTELNELTPDIRSYVVVDQATDTILMEREGSKPYPIASMSKIMPMYLAYRAIQNGKLKMEDKVLVPGEIVSTFVENPDSSSVGLEAGVEYSVKDLMYAIMMVSGNDATSALMWHIYGTEQAAVEAIRSQLNDWNIQNFKFYTTSGLPNQYIPEHLWMPDSTATDENTMSAADVAIVAKHVIEEFPQILDITSTMTYYFMEGTDYELELNTSNALLPGLKYGRDGITGLKSGFTDAAGKNFVATSTENGRKIISVVMGVQEPYNSYEETGILLDGLLKHPDLYQLADLPKNLAVQPLVLESSSESSGSSSESEVASQESSETHRESFLTRLMRGFWGIFE